MKIVPRIKSCLFYILLLLVGYYHGGCMVINKEPTDTSKYEKKIEQLERQIQELKQSSESKQSSNQKQN